MSGDSGALGLSGRWRVSEIKARLFEILSNPGFPEGENMDLTGQNLSSKWAPKALRGAH